jgi:Protein of unknown function (DUF3605)
MHLKLLLMTKMFPKMATNQCIRTSSSPPTVPGEVVITNPNVAVTLPVLAHGYRASKATWPELVQIVNVDRDIPRMSRSRSQQHAYEVFRHHMKEQYQSGTDFILISKFGFDSARNRDGKWQAIPQLGDVENSQKILVPNDFPYFVEDSVVHYVLWQTKDKLTEQQIDDARQELQNHLRALDIVHWINPRNLQSLPEIDHVHFLCLLSKHGAAETFPTEGDPNHSKVLHP